MTTLQRLPYCREMLGFSSCDIEALSRFERDVVLDYLLYTMGPEQRGKFQDEYPQIYERLHRTFVHGRRGPRATSNNGKGVAHV